MTSRRHDTWALLRLLHYAKTEAERLGLEEAARLLDMPALSICLAERDRLEGVWPYADTGPAKKPARLN